MNDPGVAKLSGDDELRTSIIQSKCVVSFFSIDVDYVSVSGMFGKYGCKLPIQKLVAPVVSCYVLP